MIHVVYDRPGFRVTVRGHAGAGDYGHDLVCAAVSVITATLAQNVSNLIKTECAKAGIISLENGHAEISVVPKDCTLEQAAHLIFDAVTVGYRLLAEEQKDFIKFDVRI